MNVQLPVVFDGKSGSSSKNQMTEMRAKAQRGTSNTLLKRRMPFEELADDYGADSFCNESEVKKLTACASACTLTKYKIRQQFKKSRDKLKTSTSSKCHWEVSKLDGDGTTSNQKDEEGSIRVTSQNNNSTGGDPIT